VGTRVTDPVTTALIVAGAKKLGAFAVDWAKGGPPERLAAALAARVSENDFQLLSFESLARDDDYRDFVSDTRQQLQFDDWRAAEIVSRHVGDVRGDVEHEALVRRIVALLRALLPAVVPGGSEALGLQTALQHEDAVKTQEGLEANQQKLEAIHEAITAALASGTEAQRTESPLILDRRWLTGRASDRWARLIETNPDAAADLKRQLGEKPTAERIRDYVAATDRGESEVWDTVVAIVDELGDWQLLEQVALRYVDSEGADPVRGLAWAAGAADLRSDSGARDALLQKARALNERHPSLLLVEARVSQDPRQRLEILDRVVPRDDVQRVALESARAHAHFEAGNIDAAFAAVGRAKAVDEDDLLAAEVEAALIVADAREGKGLTWHNAETAVSDLTRVRDRLRAANRFDLSAEVAGKIAQVHLLFGGGPGDIRGIVSSLAPEERGRDEAALLAASLLASGEATAALELLPEAPRAEYARFVFASALLRTDPERFLRDGVPIMDQLLTAQDEALRLEAAWLRAGASLLDTPAPVSEMAMTVLDERDPVRARLHRAGVAARADAAEADAILAAGGEQPELLIERARLAADKGDWASAIPLYRRVSQLDPTPINKLAFADALREANELDAARDDALAIARRGDYPPHVRTTAYKLAYGLLQRGGDLEAQAALAEEWLDFDDSDRQLLWSYVWSLARLARYRDARSVIERRGLHPGVQEAELFAEVLIHTSPPEEALEKLVALADQLPEEVRGIEAGLAFLTLSADVSKVSPEMIERAAERLQSYPERFTDAPIERFAIDPADPLREIRPHLERRARAVAEISEALTQGEVPLAAVAATVGRDIGTLLLGLNWLPLGFGNVALDELELQDARNAIGNPVVWESTSINIAGGLGRGLFGKIKAAFQTPTIAQAVVDDARLGARDALTADPTATLRIDPTTGETVFHEYAPGELDREKHRAASVLGLLEGLAVVPNIDEATEGEVGTWVREAGHLDNPALATAEATLAVAERTGRPVYSDDPVLRGHVKGIGVGAFGTACLLGAMLERNMVERGEVDEAIATLLRSGAQGIPINAYDPAAAARAADWCVTSDLRAFLLDRRRWNNDFEENLKRWHRFLRIASTEATFPQFQRWVFRVVDAMMLALPDNEPENIVAVSAVGAMSEPITDAEKAYRQRLIDALDFVRQFYGVQKHVGQLVVEWQRRAEESSAAEGADADAGASTNEPAEAG
jgi:tetratricopeptide (TPR) repeat protein